MTEARRAATEAVLAAALSKVANRWADQARTAAEEAMRTAGSGMQRVDAPDGADLGSVSLSAAGWTAEISDPAALLDWVEVNRPDEVVTAVRPAYLTWLKANAVRNARPDGMGPYPVDPQTGAVIPGVRAVRTGGQLTVRPTARTIEDMTALLSQSRQLPAAEETP